VTLVVLMHKGDFYERLSQAKADKKQKETE
jgi:hypothetical protein